MPQVVGLWSTDKQLRIEELVQNVSDSDEQGELNKTQQADELANLIREFEERYLNGEVKRVKVGSHVITLKPGRVRSSKECQVTKISQPYLGLM